MVVMLVSKIAACSDELPVALSEDIDEIEGNPGAVIAVCVNPSIVVVIDTSLGIKAASTVEAESELDADEVSIQPHHFQHFQL